MARGRERQVICASCKRYCRRDKAVYIEKVVFSNPIERKDVVDQEDYRSVFKREVAYCPGCGKHLRVYEKKKQENERRREREIERATNPAFGRQRSRKGGYGVTADKPEEKSAEQTTQTIETTEPTSNNDNTQEQTT